MKNLIILILVLLFILFFALAPPVYAADTITISAAKMVEPIQADVFHIVIETEATNKPSTIRGRLHGGRITQIWVWQILNNNGTGNCEIKLYEFECTFTADVLMPSEITIAYLAPPIRSGCHLKPVTLSLEYEEEYYSAESAVLPVEEYCISLPLVRN
jgi:hypothetical protein